MNENTPARYHPAHVAIHWLMAVIILITLAVGKLVMPSIAFDDPQKPAMLQTHMWIGALTATLLVIRLVMRYAFKLPAEANENSPVLRLIAKVTQLSLYALLFGMVASGLSMYFLADLPAIFSGAQSYPQDFSIFPARVAHGLISSLLTLLVFLHIGAALFHQFVQKDGLLSRMWFGK